MTSIRIFCDERKYDINDKQSKKILSEEIRLRRGNIDSYDKVSRQIIGAVLQILRHFSAPPSASTSEGAAFFIFKTTRVTARRGRTRQRTDGAVGRPNITVSPVSEIPTDVETRTDRKVLQRPSRKVWQQPARKVWQYPANTK